MGHSSYPQNGVFCISAPPKLTSLTDVTNPDDSLPVLLRRPTIDRDDIEDCLDSTQSGDDAEDL